MIGEAPPVPSDRLIKLAFERGRCKAALGTKYGRTQCPYGESRPYQRDAWLAGYDFEAGPPAQAVAL